MTEDHRGVGPEALRAAGWANIAAHLAGLGFAALAMRPGTLAIPLAERRVFLSRSPAGWCAGWAAWMLCALACVAYLAALTSRLPRGGGWRVPTALAVACAGAAVDLLCDVAHVLVTPMLAGLDGPGAVPALLAAERIAWAGGAIIANGAYSLATLLVTYALRDAGRISRRGVYLGWAVFACGTGMCAAGFTRAPALLMEVVTGPTIVSFVAWVWLTMREAGDERAG